MEPINTTSSVNSLDNRSTAPPSQDSSSLEQSQFIQLLSNLLSVSRNNNPTNNLTNGGFLTPLLLTLVEQMLADQVQTLGMSSTGIQSGQTLPSAFSAQAFSQLGASGFDPQSALDMLTSSSPHGVPVHGPLTQNFHPGHNGLDFGVVVGTPAKATMSGKVVYAGWNNEGYGNLVIVENGPYKTYFGHLSEIPVQVGQSIAAGQTIGLTGNTGHSTGPHLHYEVRENGKPIDPTSFTLGAA
jgi:murein DD-endopeptidase MepM/ murein hydrolase activator NlpD